MKSKPATGQRPSVPGQPGAPVPYFEAECYEGTADFAAAELAGRSGVRVLAVHPAEIPFRIEGGWEPLRTLRLSTALYRVVPFAVPRPKALLGHAHFHRLIGEIQTVISRYPSGTMRTFRLSAAGQQSAVFRRLIDELGAALSLRSSDEAGDLFLRVRRAGATWEVLIRLTPRPLATRSWREVDRPGALSGPLAALMIDLAMASPEGRVFNLACGSGSLLAEWAGVTARPVWLGGGDLSLDALAAARANIEAAGVPAELLLLDGGALPFQNASCAVILTDLPWGQLVGSHATNAILYPRLLAEAARLLAPGGRLVVITHEIQLFEKSLERQADVWEVDRVLKLKIGSLRPRIYCVLRR